MSNEGKITTIHVQPMIITKSKFEHPRPPKIIINYKKILVQRVKQSLIDVFIKGVYSKPAKRNYETKKIVVKHIDKIWSSNLLDMTDYRGNN